MSPLTAQLAEFKKVMARYNLPAIAQEIAINSFISGITATIRALESFKSLPEAHINLSLELAVIIAQTDNYKPSNEHN